MKIFWFRRDLRLEDNVGLYHALSVSTEVQPIFIFDQNILNKLEKNDRRVTFIHQVITVLRQELQEQGSDLWVFYSKPIDVYRHLLNDYKIDSVYLNHDYEPYALERDADVEKLCKSKGVEFKSFKDHVIFEKDEVTKDDGSPYAVFTPYSKKWKARLKSNPIREYNTKPLLKNLHQVKPEKLITLKEMGFIFNDSYLPARKIAVKIIKSYDETRDFPGINGTTKLGLHLRFGTLSIRKLTSVAMVNNEIYLNELIWREFYMMILWSHPHVVNKPYKPAYDKIKWRADQECLLAWQRGETGYLMVDAGMRELNETGYMHNRVRMVVASFFVKHLLLDWRLGEAYFAKHLVDFELSSNNGGWQWAAGCGCDAAPYFRIFNPESQMKKFDKDLSYTSKWIPEYGSLGQYRQPIVEHRFARERCLKAYKKVLSN